MTERRRVERGRPARLGALALGAAAVAVGIGALSVFASCRRPVAAPGDVSTAQPPASPGAAPASAPPTSTHMPAMRVLLDDPRLAAAKSAFDAGEPLRAVEALRGARPADLAAAEACAWDYVEGRLLSAHGDHAQAAAAFERAAAEACPLAGYANLRGAQSIGRVADADRALAVLEKVPADLAATDDVAILRAEALSQKRDRKAALPLWRAWLARHPHGSRWVDTEIKIATALLDGVDGPPPERAKEALERATRVVVEAPKLADAVGALALRERAIALLPRAGRPGSALDELSRARQAQALLDAGEAQRAFDQASALSSSRSGDVKCRAAQVRANASRKLKKISSVDAWAVAVAACEGDPAHVQVLYTAGKSVSGRDPKAAIAYFGKLEEKFAGHRLADDARFRAALLTRDLPDADAEARSLAMLASVPEAYPKGDMAAEAVFRVALAHMSKHDWRAAIEPLDRVLALTPDDRHWATAGRAAYFRARAAEALGDAADARARYERVLEGHPLAYYMLLSHARLAREGAPAAAAALARAAERDRGGEFPSRAFPALQAPAFTRGVRLLEVGEIEYARAELTKSGALADDAESEVVWVVAALLDRAGAPELGHSFSRSRLQDHLAHYPEGRWRALWEAAYPAPFREHVVRAAGEHGVPAPLVWGIMREESGFVQAIRSHANAIGLMQLIPPTAKWVAAGSTLPFDEASLAKPEVSIALGTKLLGKLRAKHGHPALAVGAYNGGSGAVDRWVSQRGGEELDLFVELIPYDETRGYVKRVISSQAAYAWLYDRGALAEPLNLPAMVRR